MEMVLGGDVVAGLRDAFLGGGDMMAVVPLLFAKRTECSVLTYPTLMDEQLHEVAEAAFSQACSEGHAEVAALIDHVGDDAASEVVASGCVAAMRHGHTDIVLRMADRLRPRAAREVLDEACEDGCARIAECLAAKVYAADPAFVCEVLAAACDGGRAEIAGVILKECPGLGAARPPPQDSNSDLDYEMSAYLRGDHVDELPDFTLLSAAADRGDTAVLRVLLHGNADVNYTLSQSIAQTPLSNACRHGHSECVQLLLAVAGVAVGQADMDGRGPLHHAAREGRAGVVGQLLAAPGVDPNQAADFGNHAHTAPLHAAVDAGHMPCVAALLAFDGIAADQRTRCGRSALNFACYNPDKPDTTIVRRLATTRGVALNNPDGVTVHGDHDKTPAWWTALHHACFRRDVELAKVLLMAGGCRFALTSQGETPMDLCGEAPERLPYPYRGRFPDMHPGTLRKPACQSKELRAAFLSGIDYWQRKHHRGHTWETREAVRTLLLVRQRLDARAHTATAAAETRARRRPASRAAPRAAPRPSPPHLPHLPEEIWLAACSFLRSADWHYSPFSPTRHTPRHRVNGGATDPRWFYSEPHRRHLHPPGH